MTLVARRTRGSNVIFSEFNPSLAERHTGMDEIIYRKESDKVD